MIPQWLKDFGVFVAWLGFAFGLVPWLIGKYRDGADARRVEKKRAAVQAELVAMAEHEARQRRIFDAILTGHGRKAS